MKKLLIITYYWPPCGGAGVRRWLKLSKYLSQQGVKVHVLTVDPEKASYPIIDKNLCNDISSEIEVTYTNTFEPFELYKRVSRSESIPYAGFANEQKPSLMKKVSRFVRGNFFIPDPRKGWNKYAIKAARQIIETQNIDTVITTSPPHSSQLIGLELKKRNNIKWISDFRDPWTDLFYFKDFYPTKLATLVNKKQELKVLNNADTVLTVSKALKETFAAKVNSCNSSKFIVVPNGFDPDDFGEIMKSKTDVFTITYGGSLSEHQPLDNFLLAVKNVRQKGFEIEIKFIGNFGDNVKANIERTELLEQTKFTGYLPHSEALFEMKQSDAFLLIVPQTADNKGILTFKYFEYIAMQRPILAIGPTDGDLATIIDKTNTGVISDYNNVNFIEETLINWITNKQNNDSSFAEKSKFDEFNFKTIAEKLIGF